mmetsp:Transcript_62219/g.123022  ORF Transcript_62219/g.123022 Transcript_62219/m.123022 type:complete len:532 (+) Transcript_62219:314-1909(+)
MANYVQYVECDFRWTCHRLQSKPWCDSVIPHIAMNPSMLVTPSNSEGSLLGNYQQRNKNRAKLGIRFGMVGALVATAIFFWEEKGVVVDTIKIQTLHPVTQRNSTGKGEAALRQLMAGADFLIKYPFADAEMTEPMFEFSKLGSVFSRKHGRVSPQRAFHENFPDQRWIRRGGLVAKVDNDFQMIVQDRKGILDFMDVDGGLSVQYNLIKGSGSGFFRSLKSSSSTEFHLIQKSIVIKEADRLDEAAITAATTQGKRLLNHQLEKPESIEDFWDINGEAVVTKLQRGGLAIRIISYSCADTKIAQEIKAEFAGKIKTGLLDIKFLVSFASNSTKTSNQVKISVNTIAAGGDPSLFKFTHDPEEALEQLDKWKNSILDTDKSKTAVVRVELTPLNKQIVPALTWTTKQLDLYFSHVNRAQRELWEDELTRGRMEESLSQALDDMSSAGFTRACKGQVEVNIKLARREVNDLWLRVRDKNIQDYFANSAVKIMGEECCSWATSQADEKKYRQMATQLNGEAISDWEYKEDKTT